MVHVQTPAFASWPYHFFPAISHQHREEEGLRLALHLHTPIPVSIPLLFETVSCHREGGQEWEPASSLFSWRSRKTNREPRPRCQLPPQHWYFLSQGSSPGLLSKWWKPTPNSRCPSRAMVVPELSPPSDTCMSLLLPGVKPVWELKFFFLEAPGTKSSRLLRAFVCSVLTHWAHTRPSQLPGSFPVLAAQP